MKIRQSPEYHEYLKRLGWNCVELQVGKNKYDFFGKKFPLLGSFMRLISLANIIPFSQIEQLAKQHHVFKIIVGTENKCKNQNAKCKMQKYGYKESSTTLFPTKSITIKLKNPEVVFNNFSPAKRRAIRSALKHEIKIILPPGVEEFAKLKNGQLWPFGFLLKKEIKLIWEIFSKKNKAQVLLAINKQGKVLSGVLLLFHNKVCYYWMASSTNEGKKNYAPSLLVWEALRLAIKRGCTLFDFEGIEDQRFKDTKSWQGFTIFKKGFGGEEVVYERPLQKIFWPTL